MYNEHDIFKSLLVLQVRAQIWYDIIQENSGGGQMKYKFSSSIGTIQPPWEKVE